MAKNVGILAMDIYFPPTYVQQVTDLASAFSFIIVCLILAAKFFFPIRNLHRF